MIALFFYGARSFFSLYYVLAVTTGIMGLWGTDMDPIVMLAILMSVGFNVDYTAHVTYHFYKIGFTKRDANIVPRLAETLKVVAFPMIQVIFEQISIFYNFYSRYAIL